MMPLGIIQEFAPFLGRASEGPRSMEGGVLRVDYTALGKIPTVDNLSKRYKLIVDWCCMCKHSGEFIDHLLLHCCVASDIWSCVLPLFELSQVMPKSVVESCCNFGKVSFSGISTIEQLRCSKLCPYASCGIYGLRGTSGSLMEERPYVLKAYFAHFVWLDVALGGVLSMSFVDFFYSLYFLFVFFEVVHIILCIFPLPFLIKLLLIKKWDGQ